MREEPISLALDPIKRSETLLNNHTRELLGITMYKGFFQRTSSSGGFYGPRQIASAVQGLASGENPKLTVGGVEFEWDTKNGLFCIWGQPVVAMGISSTMAGFMSGLQRMVGTERFGLAIQAAGFEGAEGEWNNIILRHPTVEDGLRFIGSAATSVGLGTWELVALDRERKEARFRVKNSWEGIYQKALGVCWGSGSLAGRFAGYCTKIFETNCRAEQVSFTARGDEYDEFIVRPSSVTFDDELKDLLRTGKATSTDLAAAMERLEEEVRERTRVEEKLQQAIRSMSTPILRIWEGVLALPVIGLVDEARAAQMMERLLEEIMRSRARFAILDLTGVEVIDTGAADSLLKLVRAAGLLGSRCLISGISPLMARTVIGLDVNLAELATFGPLESALRHAIRAIEAER
jgi:rsbT co-antagonist protein RsbR